MLVLLTAAFAVIAYSGTGAVYVTDLFAEKERTPLAARAGFGISLGLTLLAMIAVVIESGINALLTTRNIMAPLSFVIGAGFTLSNLRWPMRGAGAFVAPICALLTALFLVEQTREAAVVGMDPLIAVHIGLAVIGMSAFVLAAVLSALYLMQERQLRQRTFGRLFQRLPSLNALDSATFHLVSVGFITYTVAILLGVTSAFRGESFGWDFRTAAAVLAWVVFGAVIQTRVTSGWRGRQAAMMTIAGCAMTFLVLGFYVAS
jgi:ABC-type uncharacterized transport system permease subunit